MKERLSVTDIQRIVLELQETLTNLRLSNIYDINKRTYLFKFAQKGEKFFLVCEAGSKIYLTKYDRNKGDMPSGFTMKLRKHIRARRLEEVKQLGTADRVVALGFGGFYLIFEFFSKGNIILCDNDWRILAILRSHDKETEERLKVGVEYPMDMRIDHQPCTEERLVNLFSNVQDKSIFLKNLLNQEMSYGPDLVNHAILLSGLTLKTKVGSLSKENISSLFVELRKADDMMENPKNHYQGDAFIILNKEIEQRDDQSLEDFNAEQQKEYKTVIPFCFEQYKGLPAKSFSKFYIAMDEYFTFEDAKKLSQHKNVVENAQDKKVEKIKKQQENRIKGLKKEVENYEEQARLIELNIELVDAVISSLNQALEKSFSWEHIAEVIDEQKSYGDPIASSIKKLKLQKNEVLVSLNDPESNTVGTATVNLSLTAYANVKALYSRKKKSAYKMERAEFHQDKVIDLAKEKAKKKVQMKKKSTEVIKVRRKPFWFEKFQWMISSENFLIIAGRDAHMNEQIVKKHLRQGDAYVHADIHGGASCVVKNPDKDTPVPQMTLYEAGMFCVCHSRAWDAKIGGVQSWWVNADQVSKRAESGEYLSVGAFMIRGQKNFIPRYPLSLGFALLFKVEDSCIPHHLGERSIKSTEQDFSPLPSEVSINTEGTFEETLDDEVFKLNPEESLDNYEPSQDFQPEADSSEEEEEETKELEIADSKGNEKGILSSKDFEGLSLIEKKRKFNKKDKGKLVKYRAFLTEEEAVNKIIQEKLSKEKRPSEKSKKDTSTREPQTQTKFKAHTKKQKRHKKRYAEMDEREIEIAKELMGIKNKYKEEAPKSELLQVVQQQQAQKEFQEKMKKEYKEREEVLKMENLGLLPDEDLKNLQIIDSLTGLPRKEDVLLSAVPVCAPYSVVRNYKYQIQLLPGPLKRGQATKVILSHFLRKADCEKEKNLIKSISHQSLVMACQGNVKVVVKDK